MRTIASVPGIGLVAAGDGFAGDRVLIWTSADGVRWSRVPGGTDLDGPGGQVRLTAASPGGSRPGSPKVVVAGFASAGTDAQYGSGAVWTSRDGLTWKREPSGAEFVAGEVTAVVPWDGGLVAVGDTGAPDDFAGTVWTSPAGWHR